MPGDGGGNLVENLVCLANVCTCLPPKFRIFFGINFRNFGNFRKSPELRKFRESPKFRNFPGNSRNSENFQENPGIPEMFRKIPKFRKCSGKLRHAGHFQKNPEIVGMFPKIEFLFRKNPPSFKNAFPERWRR